MLLSAYVLTYNSERHIAGVLAALNKVADDLIVLDSGSTDATLEIAHEHGARVYRRKFDDFIQQREYANSLCKHDWILFVDSDEYVDDELAAEINTLKAGELEHTSHDSWLIRREWYVLGKRVHGMYPVQCPDFRIRLYRKGAGYYDKTSPVHEKLIGFASTGKIKRGAIHHHTFESLEEFDRKLDRYLDLAVEAMIRRGKKTGPVKAYVHAVAAYLKYLLVYQCWRDGKVGLINSKYAYKYTLAKYQRLLRQQSKGFV